MITYVNIGPSRCGTTSFYTLCLDIKGINCGKIKEPQNYTIFEKINFEHRTTHQIDFLSNWDFKKSDNSILLDGSGHICISENIDDFKTYILQYVDKLKFICFIRNPIDYYSTLVCNNFIVKNKRIKIKEHIGLIKTINYSKYFNSPHSFKNVLKLSKRIYKQNEIFILPLEFFNDYKNKLSIFLNIDFTNTILPLLNKSYLYRDEFNKKANILKSIIKEEIKKNNDFNDSIKNDLKNIDSEYSSNLYSLYIKE